MSSWKIKRINRDIAKLELKIEKETEKLAVIHDKKAEGEITKAKYAKAKMNSATKIRNLNTAIARKKKARQTFEKKLKEKAEDDEEGSF